MVMGFFKLITPFIDPITREKLKFNEDLRQHVPVTQLIKSLGGEVDFEYDHSVYWPALNKLAEQKRKEYREKWIQGGKLIGEHENYLKGGSGKSLRDSKPQEQPNTENKETTDAQESKPDSQPAAEDAAAS